MGIFFANPLWFLAVLALVPLAAHLFSRTRPRKHPFPSLVLLREAIRRVTRIRQPQDRWLLILRTLTVIAIILAFLQPWLLSRFASKAGVAKTVVLVVDASASMGYADGTQTRLTQAVAAAEGVLDSLPSNSQANVVWLRAHPVSSLPEPSRNLGFLRQELSQATAVPEPGNIEGAIALALKQFGSVEGERELCVISDFQRSAWQPQTWSIPSEVRLTRIAVGNESESNVAIAALNVEPAEPSVGQKANLVARVRNLSGESRRVSVYGEAGASRVTQSLDLRAWSEGLAIMPVTFASEGPVVLKATLGEDRFPGDDVRYGIANIRGALPVRVSGAANDPTLQTWVRALRALDGVTAHQVSEATQAPAAGARVLFVAGWNGSGVDELRAHVKSGGGVVLQPAGGLPWKAMPALTSTGAAVVAEGEARLEERSAPGWALRVAAEEHPVFALFASGTFGDPAAGKFRRRFARTDLPGKSRVLLEFEDGAPALAIFHVTAEEGMGPVVYWNLDLGATDWTSRNAFVPFFGELVKFLASITGVRESLELQPGDLPAFEPDVQIDPRSVELCNEKEEKLPTKGIARDGAAQMESAERIKPGLYRWMAEGATLRQFSVNFPESESDLRRLDRVDLEGAGGAVLSAESARAISRLREGIPIWAWCIAFAALCLLGEGLLLRKMSRGKPAAAEASREKAKEMATV